MGNNTTLAQGRIFSNGYKKCLATINVFLGLQGDYKTHNLSTNNCRLESIKESKLYSPILQNGGRCIIAVEGFYEWQTTNKVTKNKQPYYIYSPQDASIKVWFIFIWLLANKEGGPQFRLFFFYVCSSIPLSFIDRFENMSF